MAYEQRDNSGTLFKNEKKEKDSHPNMTGKAMIGGVLYYVSAWTKEGNKGKFQSLSFKPVTGEVSAPPQDSQPSARTAPNFSDLDDDIPF